MNDLIPGVRITGEVTYRGENIFAPSVDVCALRRQIGMVFQKPNPFPMSIYDNIAYGPRTHGIRAKARLDDIVERSLRDAAIWDEVKDRLKSRRSAYPAVSSSGFASHAHWLWSRMCCSWTSRRAPSTQFQLLRSKNLQSASKTGTLSLS